MIIDTHVSIWRRTWVEVDAETDEEALTKCLMDDYDVDYSEFLYETEEIKEDEDGTYIEIMNDRYETLHEA